MKGKWITFFVCVVVMIFGVQATISAATAEKLSDADIAAIKKVLDAWVESAIAGDLDAILALFTDQTVEIYPNGIANVGKANLTRRWKGFWPNYDYLEMDSSDVAVAGFGDTAMCCFRFMNVTRIRDAEETTKREGTQYILFKKIDGSWKIACNHWIFN